MIEIRSHVGGGQVNSHNSERMDVFNPATRELIATVPVGDPRDVDDAVELAKRAWPTWSQMPALERSKCLIRLAELIEAHADDLALAETDDNGKPYTLAREFEIPRAASNFRFFAGAILHTTSDAFDLGGQGMNYTLRRSRGVAGCISPWNLPLYLFTWKIAPALATGNTVVAKPSEVTPLSAYMLGELSLEAGFPPGVFNVVHGRGDTVGARIVSHPDVPTITFTGGTATGAQIASTAGPMFKRMSLELGGKNPLIICEDADIEAGMQTIVRACFQNSGQICTCASRILVHRERLKGFMARFLDEVSALKVGDPVERDTDLGPLVSEAHRSEVKAAIQRARDQGATVAFGGEQPTGLPSRVKDGAFLQPTVLMGLDQACSTNQEEIFGPVVSVQGFDTHNEAVQRANAVPFGLACSIWTKNLDRAHRMSAMIDAGMIWVNAWMLRDLRTPFGGMKQSGIGREGGEEALRFFTEPRSITIGY